MAVTSRMIVALGSTRRPKVEAVREAMALVGPPLGAGQVCEVRSVEVPSGVGHTPLSREQTMAGARGRVAALLKLARAQGEPWTYFVGLEGGLDVVSTEGGRLVFLQNWAYVSDGERGAFGQSGGVLLPEVLVKPVVEEGVELAEAIDALTGERGIRDGQGAWGILTAGIITRQDAFRVAVVNAFAPFLLRAGHASEERTKRLFEPR